MALLETFVMEAQDIDAIDLRVGLLGLQEGVMAAGDLKVAAGAGVREVTVAAGRVVIQGDVAGIDQGRYSSRNDAAVSSNDAGSGKFEAGGIAANLSSDPLIAMIVARVYDQTHDGSGLRKTRFEVITGVPTGGATLDNRNGAAALPGGCYLIADVLVPGGNPVSIPVPNVRDRRKFAKGSHKSLKMFGGNYTVTDAAAPGTLLDTTNLNRRVEATGNPIEVKLRGNVQSDVNQGYVALQVFLDGAEAEGVGAGPTHFVTVTPVNRSTGFQVGWEVTPTPGSHLVGVAAYVGGGTVNGLVQAAGISPLQMAMTEITRQNTDNT